MDPVTIGAGIVGSIGGLLRKRRTPTNPYARQQQEAAAGLGEIGQTARQGAARYTPQSNNAADSLADLLRRNPYTSTRSAAALNEATEGVAGDTLRAKSNLTAELARRGIVDGSELSGGLAAIEDGAAARYAAARRDLARDKADAEMGNAEALFRLLTGQADRYTGQALDAGGQMLSLGTSESRFQQQRADALNAQDAAGLNSLLASLGGLFARGSKPRP